MQSEAPTGLGTHDTKETSWSEDRNSDFYLISISGRCGIDSIAILIDWTYSLGPCSSMKRMVVWSSIQMIYGGRAPPVSPGFESGVDSVSTRSDAKALLFRSALTECSSERRLRSVAPEGRQESVFWCLESTGDEFEPARRNLIEGSRCCRCSEACTRSDLDL